MLAVIDYESGNQTSVRRALEHLDVPCVITSDSAEIARADGVVFPGVGAAGQAMDNLRKKGLDMTLRQLVERGGPVLGVCIGCQILLEWSEENDTKTLGIVDGLCRRFDPALAEEDGQPIRVPHMGWNSLKQIQDSPLFEGIEKDAEFYFVHSYFVDPKPELVMATTYYGQDFCSVYGRPGLWAAQFHPEKSGRPGLRLLRNFYDYCKGAARA